MEQIADIPRRLPWRNSLNIVIGGARRNCRTEG